MFRKLLAVCLFGFASCITLYAAQAADEAPPPRPVVGGDKKPDGKGIFGDKFGKGKFGEKFGSKFDPEKLKQFKGKIDPEKLKDLKGKFGDKFGKGKFKKEGGESDE